jgi:hypothetical protein
MSDESTKKMLRAYEQSAAPTLFLSGFFQAPKINFHTSESIEFDIERSGEAVAVPIADLSVSGNKNEAPRYTNKEFVPPILKEEGAINAFDMIKRQIGNDPFKQPSFIAAANLQAIKLMRLNEDKIRRNQELQASQVLQTGVVTLINSAGVPVYTIDYSPKATHILQTAISWSSANATILPDLDGMGDVIRQDGKTEGKTVIMGGTAYRNFIKDSEVQAHYDNRRIDQGSIHPMKVNAVGGKFRGTLEVGQYQYDIWTYDGRFDAPDTGTNTPFIDPNFVVMIGEGARFDATFGAIPKIAPPDPRVRGILGGFGRSSQGARRMDMTRNAWFSPDGENLMFSSGTRPLMIPTAIDKYASLNTVQP